MALNVFVLFAFCNLAVFYGIRSYLADQAMPEALHGVLIGLFSASALVCRPWISLRLSPRNALRGTALGMACILAALPLYAQCAGRMAAGPAPHPATGSAMSRSCHPR